MDRFPTMAREEMIEEEFGNLPDEDVSDEDSDDDEIEFQHFLKIRLKKRLGPDATPEAVEALLVAALAGDSFKEEHFPELAKKIGWSLEKVAEYFLGEDHGIVFPEASIPSTSSTENVIAQEEEEMTIFFDSSIPIDTEETIGDEEVVVQEDAIQTTSEEIVVGETVGGDAIPTTSTEEVVVQEDVVPDDLILETVNEVIANIRKVNAEKRKNDSNSDPIDPPRKKGKPRKVVGSVIVKASDVTKRRRAAPRMVKAKENSERLSPRNSSSNDVPNSSGAAPNLCVAQESIGDVVNFNQAPDAVPECFTSSEKLEKTTKLSSTNGHLPIVNQTPSSGSVPPSAPEPPEAVRRNTTEASSKLEKAKKLSSNIGALPSSSGSVELSASAAPEDVGRNSAQPPADSGVPRILNEDEIKKEVDEMEANMQRFLLIQKLGGNTRNRIQHVQIDDEN